MNNILKYFSNIQNRSHVIHIKNKLYRERFGGETERAGKSEELMLDGNQIWQIWRRESGPTHCSTKMDLI